MTGEHANIREFMDRDKTEKRNTYGTKYKKEDNEELERGDKD